MFHAVFRGRKGLINLGVVAGGITYWRYVRGQNFTVLAEADLEQKLDSAEPNGIRNSLKLRQVQVAFRHGARTPLHTFPKLSQAEYDPKFFLREHAASGFPFVALSSVDGKPPGVSPYQKHLDKAPLKGGSFPGDLTTLGKEQMYLLGLRLRRDYEPLLSIGPYDPKSVSILSTNIRRTILSARGVLAGYFGAEHLTAYAEKNGPVKIWTTDPNRNILIPDTRNCPVLQTVNHAAQMHTDDIPPMKEHRLIVEAHVEEQRQKNVKAIEQAQSKLTAAEATSKPKKRVTVYNNQRQPFLYDPVLHPLREDRARAIEKVTMFWSDALCRHPDLAKHITPDDMKALVYLKNVEIEEFEGKFESGHRLVFQFEKNPFFYDSVVYKEFKTTLQGPGASITSVIHWKPTGQRDLGLVNEDGDVKKSDKPRPISFMTWLVQPIQKEEDDIGKVIREEVWINPLQSFERDPKHEHHNHKKLNFIFGRDDVIARVAHGWQYPPQLEKYKDMIYTNATQILYWAMTGIRDVERFLITRLSTGPLLEDMFSKAQKLVDGKEVEKLVLYSTHDSTLAALLEALGIWDDRWPPYGVDVVLELYQDTNTSKYYVQVLYNDTVQKIRGQDDGLISWEDFKKTVEPYTIKPKEFKEICASKILEQIDKALLRHEDDEEDDEESKEQSETPAGM